MGWIQIKKTSFRRFPPQALRSYRKEGSPPNGFGCDAKTNAGCSPNLKHQNKPLRGALKKCGFAEWLGIEPGDLDPPCLLHST
jgi:hypothetical protein